MGEWHRPYEVNLLRISLSYLLFLVVVFFCFQGTPFEFEIQRSWWLVLQNPAIDLFLPAAFFFGWLSARTGVYVGDIGVMVRVGFRRIVVPWQEIVYAEIAEVPKFPVILPRGPSLGLVLVAPSGQRRPLPARLSAGTLRWGRGSPPYVVLTQEHMTQVVNRINELAAGQRPQAWPPPGEWLFPSHPGSGRRRKATMGRRSRFLLILLGGLILFGTVNSVFGSWRNQPLEIGPPTPKPSANFVPLRPVGDVSMPLEATNADESAFTSSTIVTSAGHPSGVAYMAGWQQGASLRIASLDLASGKPLFPVVDLGAWYRVYQLAARPEGILIAGLKLTPSAHPELVPAELDVHLVALDPSTGHVRWDDRIAHGPEVFAQLYPYGVMAADSLHEPALLDWTTGAPRWTDSGNPSVPGRTDGALPPVTRIEPQLTAPLTAAAELDTSTPDDPRLAVPLDNSAWILDTQTGNWTEVTRGVGGPRGPSFTATPELIINGSVYLTADFGRDGEGLYRFPADPPQPMDNGESLWGTNSLILATTPCGTDRLCLTEGQPSSQKGNRVVLVDTGSRRNRALPDTVPTGGYAIGDRYVDPAGRVYDLTGVLLGEGAPLANAWWLTPGSLIGIDRGDPARTAGATPHATIVAVSTVDGRRTVLGQLPAATYQVTTANGYLLYATDDGFHALQYAQP